MNTEDRGNFLSAVHKFYIEFFGSFVPGFVFTTMSLVLIYFYKEVIFLIYNINSIEHDRFFEFNFGIFSVLFCSIPKVATNEVRTVTGYFLELNLFVKVFAALMFSYVFGAILHRKTPKRPDRISSFKQWCTASDEERKNLVVVYNITEPFSIIKKIKKMIQILFSLCEQEAKTTPTQNTIPTQKSIATQRLIRRIEIKRKLTTVCLDNDEEQKGYYNNCRKFCTWFLLLIARDIYLEKLDKGGRLGYPYPNLKNYLIYRGKDYLCRYIKWGNSNNDLNSKSKITITEFKHYILYSGEKNLIEDMVRMEAHIRLMTSLWYAVAFLKRLFIVLITCIVFWAIFINRVKINATLLFEMTVFGIAILWIKYSIENVLHYVRTREIVSILDAIFILQNNESCDPKLRTIKDCLNKFCNHQK